MARTLLSLTALLPIVSIAGRSEEAGRLNATGIDLLQKGDSEGAIRAFKAAFETDNTCVEAVDNIVKILLVNQQVELAEKVLLKALVASPDHFGFQVQMAQIAALRGKSEACRTVLNAIKASVNHVELPSVALILMKQGAKKEARWAVDMAIDVDGTNAQTWFTKGLVCENAKDCVEAESCYAKAVELDSALVDAWVNLGNVRQINGKTSEAVDCYEKALACSPNSPLAQYNLARVLIITQSDIERGTALLESACRNDGNVGLHARAFRDQMKGGVK